MGAVRSRTFCLLTSLALVTLVGKAASETSSFDAAFWRQAFARADHTPNPAENPATPEKIALGAALFEDVRLSGRGDLACASCHQIDLSYSDGVPRHKLAGGHALDRRTPPLWNLAWGLSWFWDGRASSIENQAAGPIENPLEMAGDLKQAVKILSADPDTQRAFAAAFPESPSVTSANLLKALASFQRTLVSPETRFDAWVKGDDQALDADEMSGLKLFVGKAGCVACHSGWRFTDESFHDIGLPGDDTGRGGVLKLLAANHAFKTPSLRERIWTAPYMHDGSLATFEDVIAHYAGGVTPRPSLSKDLRRPLVLSPTERDQLVAFLNTLSSEDPPRPALLPPRTISLGTETKAIAATSVTQKDRRFEPASILIRLGQALRIVNDDTRVHNVRIDGPGMAFSSDAQNPGDTVVIGFDQPGQYEAICGIHPGMRLSVKVE